MSDQKPIKLSGGILKTFGEGDTIPVSSGGTGKTSFGDSTLLVGLGNEIAELKCNFGTDERPTVNNDYSEGYSEGSRWIMVDGTEFICIDGTEGHAVWVAKPGAVGPRGPKGEKGDKGDTGPRGAKGDKGDRGDKGEKGDKGDKGDTGPRGEQGIQGEKGEKGDKGDKGDTGEKGEKGDKGDTGEKGDAGEDGVTPHIDDDSKHWFIGDDDTGIVAEGKDGATGPEGPQGEKGDKGDPGAKGDTGDPGVGIDTIIKTETSGLVDTYTITYTDGDTDAFNVTNGATGEKGEKGDKGDKGDPGDKGDKGDPGARGETGERGEKGDTGVGIKSVEKTGTVELVDTYTITYTNDNTSTFTVTNGAKGETGERGPEGPEGPRGIQGETGSQGPQGVPGEQGVQGEKGDTGAGINSITKTGTSGLVDTYTITYTDGRTPTNFTVTNGKDGLENPMEDAGDIIVGGTSGTPEKLSIGTSGQVLKVGSNGVEWGSDKLDEVITTAGDTVIGDANGDPAALAVGTEGQVLTVGTSGIPEWQTPQSWLTNPVEELLVLNEGFKLDNMVGDSGTWTDERYNETYTWKKFNGKIWMTQNFRSGGSTNWLNNATTQADQNPTLGKIYTIGEAVSLCPAGWRLPTKEEFQELIENETAQTLSATTTGSTAGNVGWYYSWDQSNTTEFSAYPTGYYRTYVGDSWQDRQKFAYYWTSTYGHQYTQENVTVQTYWYAKIGCGSSTASYAVSSVSDSTWYAADKEAPSGGSTRYGTNMLRIGVRYVYDGELVIKTVKNKIESIASDSAIVTEKAVRTELDKKCNNVVTAKGDLIIGNDAGTQGRRLGIGTQGQVLMVNSNGTPSWASFYLGTFTTANRPNSPVSGSFGFDLDKRCVVWYIEGAWVNAAGAQV